MDETKLITLYCFVDEFINMVMSFPVGKAILEQWQGKRGPKRQLSLAEVITLNILRFYLRVNDLKTFHRLVQNGYRSYFPGLPNYENFLKASNQSFVGVLVFLKYLLFLNRSGGSSRTFFMDSTAVSVCYNQYIASHRVTKGYATRGKTSKGWFFGFKVHGVGDSEGSLLTVFFTTGSIHDSQVVSGMTDGLEGLFVGDGGYLLPRDVFRGLYEKHRHIMSAARKNMKRLMSEEQGRLFRERSIIETTWGVLKERFQLVYHLARNMTGLFRHYFYSLVSFLLRPFIETNVPLLEAF